MTQNLDINFGQDRDERVELSQAERDVRSSNCLLLSSTLLMEKVFDLNKMDLCCNISREK